MLFVFDLDGTIYFKGQSLSDKLLDSLAELAKNGHKMISASRPIRNMLPIIHEEFHQYTMIGHHEQLACVAKESVSSEGDLE